MPTNSPRHTPARPRTRTARLLTVAAGVAATLVATAVSAAAVAPPTIIGWS